MSHRQPCSSSHGVSCFTALLSEVAHSHAAGRWQSRGSPQAEDPVPTTRGGSQEPPQSGQQPSWARKVRW